MFLYSSSIEQHSLNVYIHVKLGLCNILSLETSPKMQILEEHMCKTWAWVGS